MTHSRFEKRNTGVPLRRHCDAVDDDDDDAVDDDDDDDKNRPRAFFAFGVIAHSHARAWVSRRGGTKAARREAFEFIPSPHRLRDASVVSDVLLAVHPRQARSARDDLDRGALGQTVAQESDCRDGYRQLCSYV